MGEGGTGNISPHPSSQGSPAELLVVPWRCNRLVAAFVALMNTSALPDDMAAVVALVCTARSDILAIVQDMVRV